MTLYVTLQHLKEEDTRKYSESDSYKHQVLKEIMKLHTKFKKGKIHRSVIDRNKSDINKITERNTVLWEQIM